MIIALAANTFSIEIVESNAINRVNINIELAFRDWNYAYILVRLSLIATNEEIYIDIGYNVILVDKTWLLVLLSKVEIRRISKALRVKRLDTAIYNTNKYMLVLMYIFDIKDDINVLYRIVREIHLISNLKAYILIKNDIVDLERIVINVN